MWCTCVYVGRYHTLTFTFTLTLTLTLSTDSIAIGAIRARSEVYTLPSLLLKYRIIHLLFFSIFICGALTDFITICLSLCLYVRACCQAARLKGFAMGTGSGSGMDPRQSMDFYPESPDIRGMNRGGEGGRGGGGGVGGRLGEGDGMRMSRDGRLMVGTEKENLYSGNGNGNGRTDLPVVSESIRNLRTEKARCVQCDNLLHTRICTLTDIYIYTYLHIYISTYIHIYIYTHIHIYIYIYVCVCVCVCVCVELFIYTHIHSVTNIDNANTHGE